MPWSLLSILLIIYLFSGLAFLFQAKRFEVDACKCTCHEIHTHTHCTECRLFSARRPTFWFAVRTEFILVQRQQRVEHWLVSVEVFHRFARHHSARVALTLAHSTAATPSVDSQFTSLIRFLETASGTLALLDGMRRKMRMKGGGDCLEGKKHAA